MQSFQNIRMVGGLIIASVVGCGIWSMVNFKRAIGVGGKAVEQGELGEVMESYELNDSYYAIDTNSLILIFLMLTAFLIGLGCLLFPGLVRSVFGRQ